MWEISMDKICPHKPGSGTPCLDKGKFAQIRFGHLIVLGMTSWPRTEPEFNCRHSCHALQARADLPLHLAQAETRTWKPLQQQAAKPGRMETPSLCCSRSLCQQCMKTQLLGGGLGII